MASTWIVVGGGPTQRQALPQARNMKRGAKVIACNSGIGECLRQALTPSYVMLVDPVAVRVYAPDAQAAQRLGSRLVTSYASIDCCRDWGLNPDNGIRIPPRPKKVQPYQARQIVHPRFTGLIALQVALLTAETVHLVGFDGYRSNDQRLVPDTVDGRPGRAHSERKTIEWIRPFLQSCINALPRVRFIHWGTPTYEVSGVNYSVIPIEIRQKELHHS